MESWTFVSRDPEETRAAGRELGRSIGVDGVAIALIGPLGAGKTVFVKGLAEGLGVDPRRVSSPTFVIAQQYPVPEGPTALHHVDLYRLEAEDELVNIGFDDMLAPGAVLAVEWADRFPGVLGKDAIRIDFEGPSVAEADGTDNASGHADGPGRRAVVQAGGPLATRVAADWFDRIESRAAAPTERGFEGLSSLVTLLVAGLSLLASLQEIGQSVFAASPCPNLASIESDRLGTRRARCVADASGGAAVEGVARLVMGDRLDANTATTTWLESLPGVGPTRAAAIVEARPYASIEDLSVARGIGPVTKERLGAFLEVRARPGSDDGAG